MMPVRDFSRADAVDVVDEASQGSFPARDAEQGSLTD